MGVQIVQRPELWNAVVIQVPLLDMLRYEQIAAGAAATASAISSTATVPEPSSSAPLKIESMRGFSSLRMLSRLIFTDAICAGVRSARHEPSHSSMSAQGRPPSCVGMVQMGFGKRPVRPHLPPAFSHAR